MSAAAFAAVAATLLLGLMALASEIPLDRLPTGTGQWWQYRGDQRLSGRSRARGDIERPAIEWAHSLAASETLLAAAPGKGAETIPFGPDHWREAVSAYARFGKGRHRARLNFGDCLSYAVAMLADQPLLCTGSDFSKTDVTLA